MVGAMEKNYDLKLNINQWKIQALFKKIIISRQGLHHLCCLMGTKFWKKTLTLVLLNQGVCCANQRPFQSNRKLRITVLQWNWFGFNNSFSVTKYRIRASCQQFGLFMAWIMLKIPFWMALEGHGVFVAKIQQTLISQIFLNWFW